MEPCAYQYAIQCQDALVMLPSNSCWHHACTQNAGVPTSCAGVASHRLQQWGHDLTVLCLSSGGETQYGLLHEAKDAIPRPLHLTDCLAPAAYHHHQHGACMAHALPPNRSFLPHANSCDTHNDIMPACSCPRP